MISSRQLFGRQWSAVICTLAVLVTSLLGGCDISSSVDPEEVSQAPAKLKRVLCTTGMVGDMAQAILGEEVEVTVLMGAKVDPHLFLPVQQDVAQMAAADAIIFSGLHLEAGLASTLEKMVSQNKRAYALSTPLTKEDGLIEVADGLYDPHFWNDLQLWQKAAHGLAAQLSQWNPEQADQYTQRANEYARQMQHLHDQSLLLVEQIPEQQRILISAHDAFGYFGRSLGIEVAAVQGISTNSEPSVKKIESLIQKIVKQKVRAIFAESSVNNKALVAIIEGCKQQGYPLELGGTLYSDAMGPAGSGAGTFAGMYNSNIQTIVDALKD